MVFRAKHFKLMPLLLIIASIIFVISDQILFQKKQKIPSVTTKEIDGSHIHRKGDDDINYSKESIIIKYLENLK